MRPIGSSGRKKALLIFHGLRDEVLAVALRVCLHHKGSCREGIYHERSHGFPGSTFLVLGSYACQRHTWRLGWSLFAPETPEFNGELAGSAIIPISCPRSPDNLPGAWRPMS